MIEKIRSNLSAKVFLITSILLVVCCSITYLCIACFAPYIYSHDLMDAEVLADELSKELSYCSRDEVQYFFPIYSDILAREYEDEFIYHIFQSSGAEVTLPYLDTFTGKQIEDYENEDTSEKFQVSFADSTEEYVVLIARNTNKESQIIQALQKSLPVLSTVIIAVSIIAAFFYTSYLTKPIKKISRLSKQMADMDFRGLCPPDRTDEIGVLSHSLNDLAEKLVETLSELQEANKKLQADIAMERKLERQRVEFFSAASHELKTPITIIKGQLQGMLYQVGRYKDRETYLVQSLEVTDTLEKMVQELLIISRIDTPGYVCNKCSFNLSNLINGRLIAHEDLFILMGLTVERTVSPGIYIWGDMQLLQKAIDNLLGNACSYSEAGNHVCVKLWKDGEKIHLTIENTGVHIPDEDIPELFEAFYRVDQSRNRQTGGTGLGLYIVKAVLDLHEAKIEIANTIQGVIVFVQF